jgi:hypothetical protein
VKDFNVFSVTMLSVKVSGQIFKVHCRAIRFQFLATIGKIHKGLAVFLAVKKTQ